MLQRYVALKLEVDARDHARAREAREDRLRLARARAQLCDALAGDVVHDGSQYWRVRETTTARVVTRDHVRRAIGAWLAEARHDSDVLTPEALAHRTHALRVQKYRTLRATTGPPRAALRPPRAASAREGELFADFNAHTRAALAHAHAHKSARAASARALSEVERDMLARTSKLRGGARAIVQRGNTRYFVRVTDRCAAPRRRPATLSELTHACATALAGYADGTRATLVAVADAVADAVESALRARAEPRVSGGSRVRVLTLTRATALPPSPPPPAAALTTKANAFDGGKRYE